MPQFGEILIELREEKRMTQGQLASALHVSGSTISAYETGKALPTMERAIQLAEYFGVTLDFLFGRSSVRFDLAALNRPMYYGKSMGDLVMCIDGMAEEQRRSAFQVITALKLASDAGHEMHERKRRK